MKVLKGTAKHLGLQHVTRVSYTLDKRIVWIDDYG